MTTGKLPESDRETVRPEVGGRLLPVADPGRPADSTIRDGIVARNQRDGANAGQPEPEKEPWGPQPVIDDPFEVAEAHSDEIGYNHLDGEMFERFVVDYRRPVRAVESALARLIQLMTIRRDLGDTGDEAEGPVAWEEALHDIRQLVQWAVWELADGLIDLEGRFFLGFEPEHGGPRTPELITFEWLRSIIYRMFKRARYVDNYEVLSDGRGVYRQQPSAWEDVLARTVKSPDGQLELRPSPHGNLSKWEILATKGELKALRSCLALLRLDAASEVCLQSLGRYRWKRLPPKLPSPAGQSIVRRNDRGSSKDCGHLCFRIDGERREVFRDGHEQGVILTPLQFSIFNLLVRGRGHLVSFEVLEKAWEESRRDTPNRAALHVAVSELRRSLAPFGVRIENSPSLGYRLIDPNSKDRTDEAPVQRLSDA
jgi:DNA-binding winged helix-turn-helix (wHTH) protein